MRFVIMDSMLRTRTLFLFVIGSVSISACALMFTYLYKDSVANLSGTLLLRTGESDERFSVDHKSELSDRSAHIARLREQIKKGGLSITPNPSVEGELPAATRETSSTSEAIREPLLCGADDSTGLLARWPASVRLVEQAGNRVFEYQVLTAPIDTIATSSAMMQSEITYKTLLLTSRSPVQMPSPSCIAGSVVGVSISGAPIQNTTAPLGTPRSETLIGYARDGFPIYGFYEGEVDSCGGYPHPLGYRYTLKDDQETILQCFKGLPSLFISPE
jgi:hypothetical protein